MLKTGVGWITTFVLDSSQYGLRFVQGSRIVTYLIAHSSAIRSAGVGLSTVCTGRVPGETDFDNQLAFVYGK